MAKNNKKCTSKECKRFERSQAAHRRAQAYWESKPNTDSNRAHRYYHAELLNLQNERGYVFPKKERRKMFSYWWNSEVKKKR